MSDDPKEERNRICRNWKPKGLDDRQTDPNRCDEEKKESTREKPSDYEHFKNTWEHWRKDQGRALEYVEHLLRLLASGRYPTHDPAGLKEEFRDEVIATLERGSGLVRTNLLSVCAETGRREEIAGKFLLDALAKAEKSAQALNTDTTGDVPLLLTGLRDDLEAYLLLLEKLPWFEAPYAQEMQTIAARLENEGLATEERRAEGLDAARKVKQERSEAKGKDFDTRLSGHVKSGLSAVKALEKVREDLVAEEFKKIAEKIKEFPQEKKRKEKEKARDRVRKRINKAKEGNPHFK